MYFSLLQFYTHHEYFNDLQLNGLDYQLTTNCKQLMQNCGAIFKPHQSGFEIVASQQTIEHFAALVNEHNFQLEQPLPAGIDEEDVSPLIPPQLIIKVFDHHAKLPLISQGLPVPSKGCFVVSNKINIDTGFSLHTSPYLSKDNIQSLDDIAATFQLSSQERINSPVLIVSLLLQDLIKQFELKNETIKHQVTFEARKNYWQYLIFGHKQFADLNIIDINNECKFALLPKQMHEDNAPKVFISENPIALKQQSHRRFQLQAKNQQMTSVVIEQLPVAGATQIPRKGNIPDGPLVSEIYVNL